MIKKALAALALTAALASPSLADSGYVCEVEIEPNLNRTEVAAYLTTLPGCQGASLFNGAPIRICGDLTGTWQTCAGMRMTDAATVGIFDKLIDAQHRRQSLQVFLDKLGHLRTIYFMPYFAP